MTRAGSRFEDEGDVQEVPSGTINGSNTAFTLGFTPDDVKTIHLTLDGLTLRQTTDYSVSGTSITMVTAPAVGQQLYAIYRKST